jgi:2'-5' RNA ligase
VHRPEAEHTPGDTAIVLLCHEVDEHLLRWHVGIEPGELPAHITLLFPFKPLDEITDEDLTLLSDLFAAEPTEPIRFVRTGRFPGFLYLEPEDDARFRKLTNELTALWPEYRPYGGSFDDVIPHLTVTSALPEPELDAIERELLPHLPFETVPLEAWLMNFDGDEWSCDARFPFH